MEFLVCSRTSADGEGVAPAVWAIDTLYPGVG